MNRGPSRPAGAACAAVLATLAMLLAGCRAPSPSPSAGSGASQPPSPAAASTAGKPASPGHSAAARGAGAGAFRACATSGLKAATGPAKGAAGSAYVPIRFTNTSSADCTLFGYPGVSFVSGPAGSQVGNAASRMPLPGGTAHLVTLAPGAVANAVLQIGDAGNYPRSRCQPASGPYLRVYPPGQTAALYLRNRSGFGTCASKGVTTLHIEPVAPGANPATG